MSDQQRKYNLVSAFIKSYQKFIQGRGPNLEMSFSNKFDSDQRIVDGAQVFDERKSIYCSVEQPCWYISLRMTFFTSLQTY